MTMGDIVGKARKIRAAEPQAPIERTSGKEMYIDEIIRLLRPDLVVILIGLIVMLVTSIMGARMERLELWANHADILGMQSLGMLIVIIGLVLMLIHLYRLDAPAR